MATKTKDEIIVTPEMQKAGAREIRCCYEVWDDEVDEETAREIFIAMTNAANKGSKPDQERLLFP